MDKFFAIFDPDWWLSGNNSALEIADAILFLLLLIAVIYVLVYAIASLARYRNPYPPAKRQNRFLVLFSVLRNGKQVIESINYLLDTQEYPRDKYDIAVAATQLDEEDLTTLLQMPVTIVVPDKDNCTKTYAIQQVMERYSPKEYDAVVLFNSDNRVTPNALQLLNNAYYTGCDAIQGHRMTENLDNPLAVLSATMEEFNNRNRAVAREHLYRIHGRNRLLLQEDGRPQPVLPPTPTVDQPSDTEHVEGLLAIPFGVPARQVGLVRETAAMADAFTHHVSGICHTLHHRLYLSRLDAIPQMVYPGRSPVARFPHGHAGR